MDRKSIWLKVCDARVIATLIEKLRPSTRRTIWSRDPSASAKYVPSTDWSRFASLFISAAMRATKLALGSVADTSEAFVVTEKVLLWPSLSDTIQRSLSATELPMKLKIRETPTVPDRRTLARRMEMPETSDESRTHCSNLSVLVSRSLTSVPLTNCNAAPGSLIKTTR